ncbi:MAG: 50S ribosomal protein L9 [Thermodesulfobacteriota bacterium]
MRIILTQDVENLGLTGQVVNVAKGFARNKLIPGRLAVEATPANMKALERQRDEFKARAMKEKERALVLAKQIEGLSLTIAQKAGEKDKLYGSVTTMDLAEAMARQGVEMDRRKIKLADPIKALGEYEVPVKLHTEVTATLKVAVVKAE